ncbi:UNVERIFIED_CONTAM: hypothetical protein Scaly_2573700 [Sesamum calycinum]|uniref:Retrotransposon gag domain-containing protein n=1 Tax=Sesamum calycinum TaxID=2727403 RepID=A0AAW2JIU0_9LAMI
METYFQAARVSDAENLSITSMYLIGDAKLWWHSHLSDDASANRERIETWEVLKKELKDQFLPCNTTDRWVDFKVVNDPELRKDDSGEGNTKFDKKFKKKEKAKEVVTETSDPVRLNAIVVEQADDEDETEQAWARALQLGKLQAHNKGLMMVACRMNGKEMKALVDTGATNNFVSDLTVHKLGLDVKPRTVK